LKRLAGLEAKLSAISPDAEWQAEQLDQMLEDLNGVGEELAKMWQRFRAFTQGTAERVN
jgi:uncharacterized protein YoxC